MPTPEPLPDLPTYWNEQPVEAKRVKIHVDKDPRLPEDAWVNEEIAGQKLRPVVEVTLPPALDDEGKELKSEKIYIDDADGSGWMKVTIGRGMSSWPHVELNAKPETKPKKAKKAKKR